MLTTPAFFPALLLFIDPSFFAVTVTAAGAAAGAAAGGVPPLFGISEDGYAG